MADRVIRPDVKHVHVHRTRGVVAGQNMDLVIRHQRRHRGKGQGAQGVVVRCPGLQLHLDVERAGSDRGPQLQKVLRPGNRGQRVGKGDGQRRAILVLG